MAPTEAHIWARTIRPEVGDVAAEGARELLRLRLADSDVERIRLLSGKASEGTLSMGKLKSWITT